jgi:LPXTG-motif cell wall-anchored protein
MALSGTGFLPNAPITITINPGGVVVTGISSNGSGSFSASVTAPSNAGTYTVSATDGVNTSSTSVVVSASGGGSALPVTGNSSSFPLAQLGATLLAVGALIVFGVRRSASKNVREDVTV